MSDAQHNSALFTPQAGAERAIVLMLKGWEEYVGGYAAELGEGRIGEDCVLGPEWAAIGKAIHGLLNGPCGKPMRFDRGALSALIIQTLAIEGFDFDTM